MQVRSRPNPLDVIINPPDELVLEPGETQTLTVIVTNRGSRGALIEAALDIPSGQKQPFGQETIATASDTIIPTCVRSRIPWKSPKSKRLWIRLWRMEN